MRRAALTGLAVAALAAGCGGGSDRPGGRPADQQPGSRSPATAAAPPVTDGRLGDAVVARPGHTRVTGRTRRLSARDALPNSTRHTLGAEANCQDADIDPTPSNLAHVSDVIFCLMNAMREDNGLPDLLQQAQLAKASVDHSQEMVDKKYFAHDSPDGRDVVARLKQVSYINDAGEWVVGENLAWGSGGMATPRALVNAWMNSPAHRENLLSGDYKEVGMGVVFGTPSTDVDQGITVTTDFGTRSGDAAAQLGGATGAAAGATGSAAGAVAGTTRARKLRSRCKRRHGSARRRCLHAARKAAR